MNESRRFAESIAGLKYEDMLGEVIETTKHHVLDQLGVEMAGVSLLD